MDQVLFLGKEEQMHFVGESGLSGLGGQDASKSVGQHRAVYIYQISGGQELWRCRDCQKERSTEVALASTNCERPPGCGW
ncbi:MAG: hypothetical protein Q8P75_00155 [bacterium]|nr:hypothetical protein [bacterium]